jgi:hypothetical protein
MDARSLVEGGHNIVGWDTSGREQKLKPNLTLQAHTPKAADALGWSAQVTGSLTH